MFRIGTELSVRAAVDRVHCPRPHHGLIEDRSTFAYAANIFEVTVYKNGQEFVAAKAAQGAQIKGRDLCCQG